MENELKEKKSHGMLFLIIILVIFLIAGIILFIVLGSNKNKENNIEIPQTIIFERGKEIKIDKLSSLENEEYMIDLDYSEWVILNDSGNNLTLLSKFIVSKDNPKNPNAFNFDYINNILKLNGITSISARLINKVDLVHYLNCNFDKKECPKEDILEKIFENSKSTLVDVSGQIMVLDCLKEKCLLNEKIEEALYPIFVVIEVPKENIE